MSTVRTIVRPMILHKPAWRASRRSVRSLTPSTAAASEGLRKVSAKAVSERFGIAAPSRYARMLTIRASAGLPERGEGVRLSLLGAGDLREIAQFDGSLGDERDG